MAEYIDRQAAIEKIRYEGIYGSGFSDQEREDDVVDMIESIPAADVRPVVKAAWEQVEVRYEDELIDNPVQAVASMFCPNCQRYHNEVYFYGMPTERVNFCPNCGASMEKS